MCDYSLHATASRPAKIADKLVTTSFISSSTRGFAAVEDRVHVHDLHATILHLMGMDHKKLTFRFQGRDFRLTDVEGNLVHKLLA